jgi:hypothetical protein
MAGARQDSKTGPQSPAFAGALSPADVDLANTGRGLTPALYRSRAEREQRMLDSDFILAEKLARRGVDVWAKRKLTWLGDVTGETVNISPLRQVNIFESCMQAKRSFYLKALEHFGADCPGRKYFRYTVITTKRRIRAGESVDDIKKEMMRRISAWQRIIKKRYQIETLLNVGEYTFDKETRTFYFHFNILQWPHVNLSAIRCMGSPYSAENLWQEYLKFTWDFLHVHWQDNKRLENFAELMKYVLKGNYVAGDGRHVSFDARREVTPEEAEWLFHELYRRRFIVTYGAFKEHVRRLRANRQKLVYVAGDAGKKQLRVMQIPINPDVEESALLDVEDHVEAKHGNRRTENLVRGRTGPLARVSAWAEPGTIIEGYTDTPQTADGRAELERVKERGRASIDAWTANGAPAPAIALAVSKAWLCAADDDEAGRVDPLNANVRNSGRSSAVGSSRVHTTDLTLHKTGPPGGALAPAEAPPSQAQTEHQTYPNIEAEFRNQNLGTFSFRDEAGQTRVAHFDPETGEIFD